MFMKLETVKDLGLQEVYSENVDFKELYSCVEEYRCSENLQYDIDAQILKTVCLLTNVDVNIIINQDNENLQAGESIKWHDELISKFEILKKCFWWSFEYNYSTEEEYPAVSLLMDYSQFNEAIEKYYDATTKIDNDYEEGLISLDQHEKLIEETYISHGCKVYHEQYMNSEKPMKCEIDDQLIKDKDHIFGTMKLYVGPETLNDDEFNILISEVKEELSKIYKI